MADPQGFRLSPQQRLAWRYPNLYWEMSVRIAGPIDPHRLTGALQTLIDRYEILRTGFFPSPGNGSPRQDVIGAENIELETKAAAPLGPPAFDPANGPLFRAVLDPHSEREHRLWLQISSLCGDGVTLETLVAELAAAYSGCGNGRQPGPREEPLQYIDAAEILNELLESEETRAGRGYWSGAAFPSGGPPVLPFDAKPCEDRDYRAVPLPWEEPPHYRDEDVGTAELVLACWAWLMSGHTGYDPLRIGVRFSGRTHEDFAGVPGPFARYLPVTVPIGEGATARALARQLHEVMAEHREYQDYLDRDTDPEKSAPDFPFQFDPPRRASTHRFADLAAACDAPWGHCESFYLKPILRQTEAGLAGELHFDARVFSLEQATVMARQLALLVQAAVADPDLSLESLDISEPGAEMHPPLQSFGRAHFSSVDGSGRQRVKLKGLRFSLEKIEAAIGECEGVVQAAVIFDEDEAVADGERLKAFYVAAENAWSAQKIQDRLRARLPEPMLPASLIALQRMPLDNAGNPDAAALRQYAEDPGEAYEPPRNATEQRLVAIWREILRLEKVGIRDNFFRAGGHSLSGGLLAFQISDELGVPVPLASIFEQPTIAAQARFIHLQRFEAMEPEAVEALRNAGRIPVGEPSDWDDETLAGMVAGLTPVEKVRIAIPTLPRTDGPNAFSLSFAQERLWFIQQYLPQSHIYNMVSAMAFFGPLDVDAFAAAVDAVFERHEMLRTTFHLREGKPIQLIHPHERGRLDMEESKAADVRAIIREECNHPFDLEKEVARTRLVRVAAEHHVFVARFHHIASDGVSNELFLRELVTFYKAFGKDPEASPLEPLPLQYADYAAWQRTWLSGHELQRQIDFWKAHLAGLEPLQLPFDHPRPRQQTFGGGFVQIDFGQETRTRLHAYAQERGASPYICLLALFKTLLFRYTGQADLAVGVPFANRNRPESEGLIGFFINTLPLRTNGSGDMPFDEWLAAVRGSMLEAHEYQDLPFEKLVDELQLERDPSRHPIYQVVFNYQVEEPGLGLGLGDLSLESLPAETDISRFDMSLALLDSERGISGDINFNSALFDTATVERMCRHFTALAEAVLEAPTVAIQSLPLLDAREYAVLTSGLHGQTRAAGPRPSVSSGDAIHREFEAAASAHAGEAAVTFRDRTTTYGQLDKWANRIAHGLLQRGVGLETRVGICMERGDALVAAILGVLKAGAVYVPLDPAYPAERLSFIAADADMAWILTENRFRDRLPGGLCLPMTDFDRGPESGPSTRVCAQNGAYVIYTSGSTGKPKGVVVAHGNVVRLFRATHPWFGFNETDVWTLFHSYAFDFSVWEIWGALFYGGRLVVVPHEITRAPADFYRLLVSQRVTVLSQSPSAFRQLVQAEESIPPVEREGLRLRTIVFGAEALDLDALRPWFGRHGDRNPRLVNMYGITETTVHVTYRPICMDEDPPCQGSPVGVAIPDLELYVLDRVLAPVPVGAVGEILVGGAGPARGYLGRPALTAERFPPNPHSRCPGARLYKSGDLARLRADGQIEFRGRADHQIKIRGFRIEPGEIQAELESHEGVASSLVAAVPGEDGNNTLTAYIVPKSAWLPDAEALRESLALPNYMIPSRFIFLKAFPLTAHGKLDMRALPRESDAAYVAHKSFQAPASELEETLAAIWANSLGLDKVGIDDNFFLLGGDSIRSVNLLAEAGKRGLRFSLQDLFQHQTIRKLAGVIQAGYSGEFVNTAPFQLVPDSVRESLPEDVVDAYPMCRMQMGMIYHMELNPELLPYHNVDSVCYRIGSDRDCFLQAAQAMVDRHPIFRTGLHLTRYGQPLQLVHRTASLPVHWEDLSHLEPEEQAAAIRAYVASERRHAFTLAKPTLLRFAIHKLSERELRFTLTECHPILDGWSLTNAVREVFTHYLQLMEGRKPEPVPPPRTTYRDYIKLELDAIASAESESFWRDHLRGLSRTELPPWPEAGQEEYGDRSLNEIHIDFEPSLVRDLTALARAAEVSLKSVLLAAHVKAISLLCGKPDMITGVQVNGRPETEDGDRVYGLFLNIVPFRIRPGDGSWMDLIHQVFDIEWSILPHRRFPLATMQEWYGSEPLFSTVFNYVHFYATESILDDLSDEAADGATVGESILEEPHHFPLLVGFNLDPMNQSLGLTLQSAEKHYPPAQLRVIRDCFVHVIQAMVRREAAGLGHTAHRGVYLSEAEWAGRRQRLKDLLASGDHPLRAAVAASLASAGRPHSWFEPLSGETPFAWTGAYLLDPRLQPVPAGAAGEIYLSLPAREGLEDGSGRLLADPYEAGASLWRTGVVARHLTGSVFEPVDAMAARRRRWLPDFDQAWDEAWPELETTPPLLLPRKGEARQPEGPAGMRVIAIESASRGLLDRFCRGQGITPEDLSLGLFALFLGLSANRDEMVVWVPMIHGEGSKAEGLETGTLGRVPARLTLAREATLAQAIREISGQLATARVVSRPPFEDWLPTDSGRERDLFADHGFLFFHQQAPVTQIPGFRGSDNNGFCMAGTLGWVSETLSGSLTLRLLYRADLFDEAMIGYFEARIAKLLGMVAAGATLLRGNISILGETETARLSRSQILPPAPAPSIHALFEKCVAETPHARALAVPGGVSWSYDELNRRANQLAHYLLSMGVKREERIALFLERSHESVLSMLGALKAGCAYLPLDNALPKSRLDKIVAQSGVRIVITQERLIDSPADAGLEVVRIDRDWLRIGACPDDNPAIGVTSEQLAYTLFSFGPKSVPKGVAVSHRAVLGLVCGDCFSGLTAKHRFLHFLPLALDSVNLEVWPPLLNGAGLVVQPQQISDLATLGKVIETENITHVCFNTDQFHQMAERQMGSLRRVERVFVGGDGLQPAWVNRLLTECSGTALTHVYGHSETTAVASGYNPVPGQTLGASVPIGLPFAHTDAYILDHRMQLLPFGAGGRLYTAGPGLARGYLSQCGLSARYFVPHPFSRVPGARLYRTGDLARFDDGGTLHLMARSEQRVTIGGFRIEIGDIENTLELHPQIEKAVVLVRGMGSEQRIDAYLIASGDLPKASELRKFFMEYLPVYMIPTNFTPIEEIPRTGEGKVDRLALSRYEDRPSADAGTGERQETPTETKIVAIWKDVLGVDQVDLSDDFLLLGGHSLRVTQVITRLREDFNIELPLKAIFDHSELSALAKFIDVIRGAAEIPAGQEDEEFEEEEI